MLFESDVLLSGRERAGKEDCGSMEDGIPQENGSDGRIKDGGILGMIMILFICHGNIWGK